MKVKEFIDLFIEYNPDAEIEIQKLDDLTPQKIEIYYRGRPDKNSKATCDYVRIYVIENTEEF